MSKESVFVITGGTGFIGQALALELSRGGNQVCIYGRKKDFKAVAGIKYDCVESYLAVKASPNSICFHLAGDNSAQDGVHDKSHQEKLFQESLTIAKHLLNQKFKKIIYSSSAQVYGGDSRAAYIEKDQAVFTSFYARVKYEIEKQMLAQGQVVARLANVYGNGMSNLNVMSRILNQLTEPGPLKLATTAPIRDFIHLSDVVNGLIKLASVEDLQGVFNIGTGRGTTILSLAKLMLQIANQENRLIVSENLDQKSSSFVLNSSKLKQNCGWSAQIELKQGLKLLFADRMVKH